MVRFKEIIIKVINDQLICDLENQWRTEELSISTDEDIIRNL